VLLHERAYRHITRGLTYEDFTLCCIDSRDFVSALAGHYCLLSVKRRNRFIALCGLGKHDDLRWSPGGFDGLLHR
jgi:hypothetical protein